MTQDLTNIIRQKGTPTSNRSKWFVINDTDAARELDLFPGLILRQINEDTTPAGYVTLTDDDDLTVMLLRENVSAM